jgi:RimJ/RimL family protein N-acetyltransferase
MEATNMELELERSTLRSWRDDDAESLSKYANNRKIWRNLRDSFPFPYTLDEAEDWVDIAGSQEPETNFAIVVDDEAVGGVGLELKDDVFRKSAEMGYWLAEPMWGRGIVTEAVVEVTSWGFENIYLERIYAGVFSGNPGSVRVLEKAGYQREATLRNAIFKEGKVLDEIIYATWPDHWRQRHSDTP